MESIKLFKLRSYLLTILLCLQGLVFGSEVMDLTVELEKSPIGLDTARPRFSWKMKPETGRRGQMQMAYRILVATQESKLKEGFVDVYDSKKVQSDNSVLVDCLPKDLKPKTDYYWTVKVWDEKSKAGEYARPMSFDTGYFSQEEWTKNEATWIESPLEPRSNDATETWIKHAIVNLKETVDMAGYGGMVDPVDIKKFVDRKHGQLNEMVWPGCLMRKEFNTQKIKKARLYICGLGYYRAYLNGKRIGDRDLAPSDSNFHANAYYNVYDVTDKIMSGQNCLGVELVNGRWRAWPGNTPETYHDRPILLARLEMTDSFGKKQTIVTDQSWKAGEHGIVKSSFWIGEVYDANLYPNGWNEVGFNDCNWKQVRVPKLSKPVGALSRDPMPSEKIVEYHEPVKVTEPMPNVYVYDFGKQIIGRARFSFRSLKKGQKVVVRYSEVLRRDLQIEVPFTLGYYPSFHNTHQIPGMLCFKRRGSTAGDVHLPYTNKDGKKGTLGSYQLAGGLLYTDMFVSAGKQVEIFEPKFTYVGFRYLEIIGLDKEPVQGAVKAFTLRTDPEFVGTMRTGNAKLNKVLSGTQASLMGNYHSQYQDNPGAERNPAILNEGLQIENSAFWFNAHPQWKKVMHNVVMNNDYLDTYCLFHAGMREYSWAKQRRTHISGTSGYGTIPLGMYAFYNDRRAVDEFAENMIGWVKEVTEYTYWNQDHYWGSGDHIAETSLNNYKIPEDAKQREITTRPMFKAAWIIYTSREVQATLEAMGRTEDAKKVQQQIEIFNKRLLAKTELYDKEKQIWESSAFLRMGVDTSVLISDLKPRRPNDVLVKEIADEIKKIGGYQTSGARLTYYVLQQLSQNGYADLAASILMREQYPSLLHLMNTTVNTIPEAWNCIHSFTQIEGLCATGRWYYSDLVGINPSLEEPGFRKFMLQPNVPSQVDSFDFTYDSPRGEIESHWKEEAGQVKWTVVVPPNAVAEVSIPGKEIHGISEDGVSYVRSENGREVYTVGSGRYTFRFYKDEVNDSNVSARDACNFTPQK